jgi:hypothetical protein
LIAASATFALKAAAWFRRGRLLMVSPDSMGTACPSSGRNSTYPSVQISGTSSEDVWREFKIRVQAAYQAPSWAIARERAAGVVADYEVRFSSVSVDLISVDCPDQDQSSIALGKGMIRSASQVSFEITTFHSDESSAPT